MIPHRSRGCQLSFDDPVYFHSVLFLKSAGPLSLLKQELYPLTVCYWKVRPRTIENDSIRKGKRVYVDLRDTGTDSLDYCCNHLSIWILDSYCIVFCCTGSNVCRRLHVFFISRSESFTHNASSRPPCSALHYQRPSWFSRIKNNCRTGSRCWHRW